MNLYNLKAEDVNGSIVEFAKFKGKVLLIVNTATECFFTPQYEGLQWLYDQYQSKGLEILDFPCNQFGKDAPGSVENINQFCVENFKTTFLRFQKIEVNGPGESIIYTYLKRNTKGFFNKKIKWNFTKFLIDQNGDVVKRYAPVVKPKDIAADIEKLLNRKQDQ